MDNEGRGDDLDHDPAEPHAADAPDELSDAAEPAEPVAVAEPVEVAEPLAGAEPVDAAEPLAGAEPAEVAEPVEAAVPVEEPIEVAEPFEVGSLEDSEPFVETEPTEPVAVVAPEPVEVDEAPYADEPTVAHAVFAPPTPAAATFAAPEVEEIDAEVEADDDEDDDRKGIPFATKALVVGAAWVLLVLFLIGQFDSDDDPGLGPVGLDQTEEQADGTELAAGEEGEVEEPVDLDGDGEIEPGEPGFGSSGGVEGASTGDGTSGASGGTGTSGGSSGSTSGGGGTGDGTSDDAAPVTLPGGAPAPTSTTTTVKGGGGSTSTTTTKPGGGGGGGSTSTSTTTTQPAGSTPVVTATGSCQFDPPAVSISRNAKVRFTNNTGSSIKIRFSSSDKPSVDNGASYERTFTSTGIYNVGCEQSGVKSTVTITVS